jgi:hypothetical protein
LLIVSELAIRVSHHPNAHLASARAGLFKGGYVAAIEAEDATPPSRFAPPPLGGADDLDVGCGASVDEALEDLAVWLRILAQRVPPLLSDERPIARAIRQAEVLERDELVDWLRERALVGTAAGARR